MMKPASFITACIVLTLVCTFSGRAQSISADAGTVRGSVLDPSGAAVPNATVELQNPVSGYNKNVKTDAQGKFELDNIPYNPYHLSASAAGFQGAEQDVNVRTPLPVDTKITLTVGAAKASVTVTEAGDLLETDSTAHTDVDRDLFDKLPLESASSSLSSLVTLSAPGVAADSNGLFHGFGDHASNSFSIDGEPITDQQSKIFSNQIPVDAIQSLEVIQGAPPAEYGGKTSLVIVATTRSGLGVSTPHGDVTGSYGTFGSSNAGFDLSYGTQRWGNFISVNGLNSGRFLDTPEYQVFHDHGNEENIFDRLDFKLSDKDSINLNLGFTRSWFQSPNSYDAQNATGWSGLTVDNGGLGPDGRVVGPQDQRAKIRTFNIAPVWTHIINANSIFTLGAFIRQDQFNYYPSNDPFADLTPALQSSTIGQDRSLKNAGARTSYSWINHTHNIKIGAQYEHTFLTERDSLGLVDPTANAPCLNADGSPNTSAALTDPNGCPGGVANQNPNFVPLLACYDLTRTAPLPASNGCPHSTSGPYGYYGHADIKEFAFYVQDAITLNNWTFNLGVRFDKYNGLTRAAQGEPRLGVAYHLKPTNTVFRVAYARTMETPFNENLVVASVGCVDPVISAFENTISGANCVSATPESPGHRNEFHAGFQQAFGRYLVVDGEYIWKYTHQAFDFSVLGNTPITFPIEWASSKIPGYAIRATVPNYHGFTAFVVMSSVAARFFPPQVSGIGATPVGGSVFRIDHDEKFNQTTHLQYQPWKTGPWLSFNWRYDSGLVAGALPCAGGDSCASSDPTVVDASYLTPDQQFEGGLFCGSVHATPTSPISPTSLCPANQFGSTLLKVPAPGTENDDHNPPRVASRNLFDIGLGEDNIFHGDRYKWSARFTVVNLTNREALYNYLSTFSGTHYVSPRAVTATVGFHF
ncbi:MAG TPA: TonB-dependent receptor [Bryobacteraceae bacterium]|nr:TonB-dependent receptor [Bryobacteraceae bacterium]